MRIFKRISCASKNLLISSAFAELIGAFCEVLRTQVPGLPSRQASPSR